MQTTQEMQKFTALPIDRNASVCIYFVSFIYMK